MSRTLGVPVVPGPLAVWADGYAAWLRGRGYAPLTVKRRLRDVARLSRWLEENELGVKGLTERRVTMFLRAQHDAGYRTLTTPGRLSLPLEYLRQVGAAPAPSRPAHSGPIDEVLIGYRRYLMGERGLGQWSVVSYESHARRFLNAVRRSGRGDLAELAASDVAGFIARECAQLGASQARQLVVAVRSLLRYLHVEGLTAGPLQWAVPAIDPAGNGRGFATGARAGDDDGDADHVDFRF